MSDTDINARQEEDLSSWRELAKVEGLLVKIISEATDDISLHDQLEALQIVTALLDRFTTRVAAYQCWLRFRLADQQEESS